MNFLLHAYYVWVYIIGTILILANHLWIQSTVVTYISLTVLFTILFYKGIIILIRYRNASKKPYSSLTKEVFTKKYKLFRMKVLFFLLAFTVLCIIGKFIIYLDRWYFYSCTFFFLFLDRLFINATCLLQIFSDPKSEVVTCCCGCPCRGWDLIMIHTPLLFAMSHSTPIENIMIILSSLLSLVSFFYWETGKYHLVEVRNKCATHCDLQLCRENLPS